MAFMGATTEVGIADLLSVLARRGHTGRLTISAENDDTQIYLDTGKISLVSSTHRDLRLGRVLVRLGIVDDANLAAAVRDQDLESAGRSLGQILIDAGQLTPADLDRAAEEQCIESLARVIVAPNGAFVFNRDLRPSLKHGLLSLNTEGIVLEASRRADEMTRLRGLLPPPGARLGLTPNVNAQTGTLSLAESLVADALRREPMTLASLSESLPIEEVALWRAIVRLRERAMIYAVSDAPPAAAETAKPATGPLERSIPEVLQLGAAGVTPSTKPIPTLDTIRAGVQAGDRIVEAVTELVQTLVANRNERRNRQALSLYSDDYFRRRGMMSGGEIALLRRDGPPVAMFEQESVVAVRDVRVLGDGRASAIVIMRKTGVAENRRIMIFTPHASGWRIDADLT